MMDISSDFDTIDHTIILSRLHLLGVRDLALKLFTSYISDSSSSVKIYNSFSSPYPMKYGVSQGSVLGHLFIYLYSLPSIISKYPHILPSICRWHTSYSIQLYTYLFPLIHHQFSIINFLIVLMTSNNCLFLIIFFLIPPKLHC